MILDMIQEWFKELLIDGIISNPVSYTHLTPLGLMRDPEDRGHLILDPETAPVIRKIYDLALDGWGCMRTVSYTHLVYV